MAHKKSSGSASKGGNSKPKYLGVKVFGGQKVKPGYIIIRQRGTKFLAGKNVARGKDDTLYALKEGKLRFKTFRKTTFSGRKIWKKMVEVI